jgi:drug/metabolite transporter (DMT)-like permease
VAQPPTVNNRYALIGALYAFIAAVAFSGKAILVKLAYVYSVDAVTLLALRMLFALPFFIIMAVWAARRASAVDITARDWGVLAVLGILGYYLASLLDFLGLLYISASLERLVVFLYPTLVVVLSAIYFKRRITASVAVALLLSYVGIALVFAHDVNLAQKDIVLGGALVFASILVYAIYLIGSGGIITRLGSARFTGYAMTISCAVVGLHFGAVNPIAALIQPMPVYGLALAMAIFSTVLPALLLSEGIRRIGVDTTSIIGSIGPVATLVLAYLFLGETMSMMQILGATLVLAGVVFISLRNRV